MRKKIYFVLPHLKNGGAEASTVILINNLLDKDYEISLFLLKDSGPLTESLDPRCIIITPSGKVHFRKWHHLMSILLKLYVAKDITIFSRVWFANIFCLLINKNNTIIFEDSVPSSLAQRVALGRIKLWVISKIYRFAKIIICVSPLVYADLIQLGIPAHLMKIIPNPILPRQTPPFFSKPNYEKLNVSYVGTTKSLKGWDLLCSSLNSMPKAFAEHLIFHIVGNWYDVKSQLTEFTNKGGILIQHGIQQNNEIPYHIFDILVIPSLVQESFCNVFHEGLMSNCFIIATQTAVPYDKKIFEGYGVRFVAATTDGLSQSVGYIISNRQILQEKFNNRAHPILESCDVNRNASQIASLL